MEHLDIILEYLPETDDDGNRRQVQRMAVNGNLRVLFLSEDKGQIKCQVRDKRNLDTNEYPRSLVQISKEAGCVINPRVPTSSSSSVPIILIVRGVCVCLCVYHVSIVQKERYRPLFFILLRAPHLFGKKRTSEVSPFSGCPGASPSSPLFQQHYTEERRLKEPRKYEADINFHLSRIQRVSHAGGHSIPSSLSSNFIPKIVSCSTLGGEQFSKIGFQLDTFFRDSFKGCRILLLKT